MAEGAIPSQRIRADGDIVAELPVEIEIVPDALRLLMPGPAIP